MLTVDGRLAQNMWLVYGGYARNASWFPEITVNIARPDGVMKLRQAIWTIFLSMR